MLFLAITNTSARQHRKLRAGTFLRRHLLTCTIFIGVVLGMQCAAGGGVTSPATDRRLLEELPSGLVPSAATLQTLSMVLSELPPGARDGVSDRLLDLAADAVLLGDQQVARAIINSVDQRNRRAKSANVLLDDQSSDQDYRSALEVLLAVPAGTRLSRFAGVMLARAAETQRGTMVGEPLAEKSRTDESHFLQARLVLALHRRASTEELREKIRACGVRGSVAALCWARPDSWSVDFARQVSQSFEGIAASELPISAAEVAGYALLSIADSLSPNPGQGDAQRLTRQSRAKIAADAVHVKQLWLALGLKGDIKGNADPGQDVAPFGPDGSWAGSIGLFRSKLIHEVTGDIERSRLDLHGKLPRKPSEYSPFVLGFDRDPQALRSFVADSKKLDAMNIRALRLCQQWAFDGHEESGTKLVDIGKGYEPHFDQVVVGVLASRSLPAKLREYRKLIGDERFMNAVLLSLRWELRRTVMQWPDVLFGAD